MRPSTTSASRRSWPSSALSTISRVAGRASKVKGFPGLPCSVIQRVTAPAGSASHAAATAAATKMSAVQPARRTTSLAPARPGTGPCAAAGARARRAGRRGRRTGRASWPTSRGRGAAGRSALCRMRPASVSAASLPRCRPAPTTAALPKLRRSPGSTSVSSSRMAPAASHLVHSNGPWWPKPANCASSPATRPSSRPVPRLSTSPRQMTNRATHSTPEWPGTLTGTRSSCLASMHRAATRAISSRSRSVSDQT